MKWKLLTVFTCILLMAAFSIPAMQNTLSIPVTWNIMLSCDCSELQWRLEY
nr:hypothetical protein [Candidatus Freyarchaeota archaeon]